MVPVDVVLGTLRRRTESTSVGKLPNVHRRVHEPTRHKNNPVMNRNTNNTLLIMKIEPKVDKIGELDVACDAEAVGCKTSVRVACSRSG
jgi:hypothetical protein